MLELRVGDLFEAPADALGQGVNVDGRSGAGSRGGASISKNQL